MKNKYHLNKQAGLESLITYLPELSHVMKSGILATKSILPDTLHLIKTLPSYWHDIELWHHFSRIPELLKHHIDLEHLIEPGIHTGLTIYSIPGVSGIVKNITGAMEKFFTTKGGIKEKLRESIGELKNIGKDVAEEYDEFTEHPIKYTWKEGVVNPISIPAKIVKGLTNYFKHKRESQKNPHEQIHQELTEQTKNRSHEHE